MAEVTLELPDGDISTLVELLGPDVVFANLVPGVADDAAPPPRSSMGRIFGNSGPIVPLATWTPGEIGIQHAAGQRVARTLAERGCAVPEEWYVASDHPKRGLVLKTYASPPAETVSWLARAAALLCPIPITEPWHARVRTR